MKKIVSIMFVIGFAFAFTGCKKKITQFYIDYNSSLTIPATLGINLPIAFQTADTPTNAEAEFEANDTRKDRVKTIFLQDLVLTITNPPGETFSFLNSLNLYIEAEGQSKTRIAYKENIPQTVGGTIVCDVVNVDLKPFIAGESFKLSCEAVTDENIPQDVDVNVYSNFLVEAKIFK